MKAPDNQPAKLGAAPPGKLAMLYDGACEMCVAGVRAMHKFDNSGMVESLDLHDPVVGASFPDLKIENLLEELHVVDDRGRVFRGARAINEILRHQRGLRRWLAYLWYVPGYAYLADRQYKRIAGSRYERDAGGHLKAPSAT